VASPRRVCRDTAAVIAEVIRAYAVDSSGVGEGDCVRVQVIRAVDGIGRVRVRRRVGIRGRCMLAGG
jgi:hypothetical protein